MVGTMAENTFMGVPREKISWAPTIDYDKCDFCMECDNFCPHRVFERRDGDIKLVVAHPENCVVFCRACSKTCGPDAISFPEKSEVVALIKRLHADEAQATAGEAAADTEPNQKEGGR